MYTALGAANLGQTSRSIPSTTSCDNGGTLYDPETRIHLLPINRRLRNALYVLSGYPLPTPKPAGKLCMAKMIKDETPNFNG